MPLHRGSEDVADLGSTPPDWEEERLLLPELPGRRGPPIRQPHDVRQAKLRRRRCAAESLALVVLLTLCVSLLGLLLPPRWTGTQALKPPRSGHRLPRVLEAATISLSSALARRAGQQEGENSKAEEEEDLGAEGGRSSGLGRGGTTALSLDASALGKEVPACWEQHVTYRPLNMEGQSRTFESNALGCQSRCSTVAGCRHFSFWQPHDWPAGACHLQGEEAHKQPYAFSTAGPPQCGTCYEAGSAYTPNLDSVWSSAQLSARSCQAHCQSAAGCAHFTWWHRTKWCSLQGATATRADDALAVAGPAACHPEDSGENGTSQHEVVRGRGGGREAAGGGSNAATGELEKSSSRGSPEAATASTVVRPTAAQLDTLIGSHPARL